MSAVGFFLKGAGGRLLPASIPFRFFATAAGFQLAAWLMLLPGAADLATFTGGVGFVLAALHLLTLGVLAMTAIGASLQLLPVATRQPLARIWPARLSFWLITTGTILLAFGMTGQSRPALVAGGGVVGTGLLVFAVLSTDNLRRAGGLPVLAAHGWAALAALIGFVGLGLMMVTDFDLGLLADHRVKANIHMILAVGGFMAILAIGFSQILIPMFVLSHSLPSSAGWLQLGLALLSIALLTVAFLAQNQFYALGASVVALAASAVYLWLMRRAVKGSMRRRLGLSFVLIKTSWVFLLLGLLIGVALGLGVPVPNGPTLFWFVLLVGWLATFLLGVLQRIIPFLASMHISGRGGKPPLLSDLSADTPLKIHAICHFAALALCVAGISLESTLAVQLAAAIGTVGSIAFLGFTLLVMAKLKPPNAAV